LLKRVPLVERGSLRQPPRGDVKEIVERIPEPPAKRFDAFSAAMIQIAALQRDWRGIE